MRRREFISLLGGAAAWPPAARAQQASRVPWVGVLMARTENDRLLQAPIQSFRSRLQQLGWTEGHNLRIDYRWVPSYPNQSESSRLRVAATELVALQPGVILADGLHSALALQDQTRTIPIVYTSPVWKGLAHPFAPPDEQMTGFADSDYSKGGKLLSLLKGAAPNLTRVALIFGEYFVDDSLEPFLRIIEGVAPSYGLIPAPAD